MSGGFFDYKQKDINDIAERIEEEVAKSGKPIPKEEWDYWLIGHPEEAFHRDYPEEVLRRMEEAIYALKRAAIYAQRVDWLMCDDDGDETFEKRLSEELQKLDKKSKMGENGIIYYPVDRNNCHNEDE